MKGGIDVTGRQGRRRRPIMNNLKGGYCELKAEAPELALEEAVDVS